MNIIECGSIIGCRVSRVSHQNGIQIVNQNLQVLLILKVFEEDDLDKYKSSHHQKYRKDQFNYKFWYNAFLILPIYRFFGIIPGNDNTGRAVKNRENMDIKLVLFIITNRKNYQATI